MKSNETRSLASLSLILFVLALLPLLAQAQQREASTRHPQAMRPLGPVSGAGGAPEWRLAFELAFGEGSPYSSTFPSLYDEHLTYEVKRAITKDVLDRIVSIALVETGAKRIELGYRPGGYKDFPVVPSAQLVIVAADAQTHRALNIIGYLAQQTLVIGSKRTPSGTRAALEIIERRGRRLNEREWLEKFWRRLSALSPKLGPGFSSIEKGARPGIYIIDSDGDWLAEDFDGFKETIQKVSQELGIETGAELFQVEYAAIGNDWKMQRGGAAYLDRLSGERRFRLRRRLVRFYQPQVKRWISNAFRKYAPSKSSAIRHKGASKFGLNRPLNLKSKTADN